MDPQQILSALSLPDSALVQKRIPKTILVEHGAPTSADRKLILNGIEELHWLAVLRPDTIAVSPFVDDMREYLEIAVLSLQLREARRTARIIELLHRAIPYPLVLLTDSESAFSISFAHKRWAQTEHLRTVLDGEVLETRLDSELSPELLSGFLNSIDISKLARKDLLALYQSLIDACSALEAAKRTGDFRLAQTSEQAQERQAALAEYEHIDAEIARVLRAASKEKQMVRKVALNQELKKLRERKANLDAKL